MDLLLSRRVWGGLLAIVGAATGAAAMPVENTETMISAVVTVIGGVLSLTSKFFPKQS